MLLIRSVNFPDNKMKGIVNSEGSEDNSCMSNSEECGNIVDICPKIGETARPGNAFKAQNTRRKYCIGCATTCERNEKTKTF